MQRKFLTSPLFHLLLISVLGLLCYSNTFHAAFHFDDVPFIVDNPAVKDFNYFLNPSSVDNLDVRPDAIHYFKTRYVGYLSFWANYRLGGLDVMGYHIGNFIIHTINAILIYLLVALVFRTPLLIGSRLKDKSGLVALFSGLFFVAHPLQTEAVTYILQRTALLSAMFYIFSTLAYAGSRLSNGRASRWALYTLALASAVLGMKTKENAFTLPVTIALFEFMFLRSDLKKRALFLIPFLLTMLIIPLAYIDLSMTEGLSDVLDKASSRAYGMSRSDYLFTQFGVITMYLRILFFPINQNVDHDVPISRSFFDPTVIPSFLLLLFVVAFGVYLFYRSRTADYRSEINSPLTTDSSSRLVAFGIFWFFITLSVESSILPLTEVAVEYRVYLPSAGFLIATTVLFFSISDIIKKRQVFLGNALMSMLMLTIFVLAWAAHARNTVWADDFSLWKDAASKSPNKARPHNNLGNSYLNIGDLEKAIKEYDTVLTLKPEHREAHYNLGNAYYRMVRMDKAIENYKIALKRLPDRAVVHFSIAEAYKSSGQMGKAIEHYRKAIELKQDYPGAHFGLGSVYYWKGSLREARREFETVLELEPDNTAAQRFLDGYLRH
jgi:Tfp pilus assembly protein PilF